MNRELSKKNLQKVVQAETLDNLSIDEIISFFQKEKGIADFAPDGTCRVDPRDGSMVIFNPKRAKRPHDNRTDTPSTAAPQTKPCPICDGNTTGVVDVADLSEGTTFINKNLFPCVYPFDVSTASLHTPPNEQDGLGTMGLHFLQWTSSHHDKDFHNMDIADLAIVLKRLGALEQRLLEHDSPNWPDTSSWHEGRKTRGFVSVIKNVGAPVGGSLSHGHQQLVYSNVMPTQTYNNWRFKRETGTFFSTYIRDTIPKALLVKELPTAVLLVPPFMRRPYNTILAVKNPRPQYLFDLNDTERQDVAFGWSRMAAAFRDMLPRMGRDIAYNVLVHTGPGAGIYIEFLPFTQEMGGYEQLGLWVCQDDPNDAAAVLRTYFE